MKVGDLVQVMTVLCNDTLEKCPCWFCLTGNPRVGTVLSRHMKAYGISLPEYDVLFGEEIYTVYDGECEVLSESR